MLAAAPAHESHERVMRLRDALGVTRTIAEVLRRRGHELERVDVARSFLDPRLADLTPPDAMVDREAATARLADAIRRRERVVVFGDYDVDGITSAAIITIVLRALGGDVATLLASRFDGGYGFSDRALERALEARPTLIVTCDCGSSDHARLAAAKAAGIDVVVIDHHLVPPEPLPVVAFLNPHRPECGFPFKHLASCGLALSLGAALRAQMGVAFDLRPLLDLVALGTIADVAPLVGDNRALVRAGLARVATAPRPGIEALAVVSGLPAGASVWGEDVSFKIAPRINAPGRLGAPDAALELLLEGDPARAAVIAARLEEQCNERRGIERRIVAEALAQVEATGQGDAPAIVVAAEGWHAGVVGIVAARLVDRFDVPAVVVALDGGKGHGSVRGPQGARLHDALRCSSSALIGFGGHQAAAGVVVAAPQVERFREMFAEACARQTSEDLASGRLSDDPRLHEAILDPADDPFAVLNDLERLEPCGEGNPAPLLAVRGAEVSSVRLVKGEHLRLVLAHGGRWLDAFGYGLADRAPSRGDLVDLHVRVRRDNYGGRRGVELRIVSIGSISGDASRAASEAE